MSEPVVPQPVVHVVDDDAAVRESIAFLLESDGLKARTWAEAPALLDALAELEPGCVVTDVRMPEMNGVELVRRLKAAGASHPIVMITGHADVPLAVEAMKAGVADFIEKPFDDEVLLAAVRAALAQREGRQAQDAERAAVRERLAALSGRERQVLDGLVGGKANKVIAFDLGISPRTVEIYRAHVMSKMQAGSLSELVRMTLSADA